MKVKDLGYCSVVIGGVVILIRLYLGLLTFVVVVDILSYEYTDVCMYVCVFCGMCSSVCLYIS